MNNFKNLQAHEANGDLSKPWFISFYFRDPQTGIFKRFRETSNINRISNVKDRREALYALKQAKEVMLNNGWSPFLQISSPFRRKHVSSMEFQTPPARLNDSTGSPNKLRLNLYSTGKISARVQ